MRKRINNKERLIILSKKYLNIIINEVYDNPLYSDYKKILNYFYDDYNLDTYRFSVDSGNSYDLDFIKDIINSDFIRLKDSSSLSKYFNDDVNKQQIVIDVGFTPTEIKKINVDSNIIGTEKDPYIKKTNRGEHIELLNKISFLLQEYMKNNKHFNIFSIGKNTHEGNLLSYIHIFKKIFSDKFEMMDVRNPNYLHGSFYFIKKELLLNNYVI